MSVEISLLKAQNGECIWLRYGETEFTNIIIDSGPACFEKDFRKTLAQIRSKEEVVDLLILTHIDDDHIKGFSKYILKNDCKEIKEIWLNGEGKINTLNQEHSPRNIGSLVTAMKKKGLNIVTPILRGRIIETNGATLTVINPTQETVDSVAEQISKHTPHKTKITYSKSLDKIMAEDKFISDRSLTNKASISFVFSYNDKYVALLGDAHANDIIEGKKIYFSDIKMDCVKLAHHGSKYNTSEELIRCMDSSVYIICRKNNIDKETIARIVQNRDYVKIYTNYTWWGKVGFFTDDDKKTYLDTKKLEIQEVNTLNI